MSVAVSPARDTLTILGATQLTAAVANTTNQAVSWTVLEGAAAGSVSAAGLYTAGATPGNYRVEARSLADPAAADTAELRVVPAPTAGITVTDSVLAGASFVASVPSQANATYAWVVAGGAVTAGSGTRQITVTAGGIGSVSLTCTVTNLAGTEATEQASVGIAEPPGITEFTAAAQVVTTGTGTTLTAVYAGGAGTIDEGVGAIPSGGTVPTGPLSASKSFTLTVAGFRGATATATQDVTVDGPPTATLTSFMRMVAAGDSALFRIGGAADEFSLAPGPDPLPPAEFHWSEPLSSSTLFTLSARNSADSVVTDTLTIPVVPRAPGTLTDVAPPGVDRIRPAAVVLANGLLLLAGTTGGDVTDQASAELFDPATRLFSATGSMTVPRMFALGVALLDGRALVTSNGTADVYDHMAGTFSAAAGATRIATPAAIARLPDGRVLVVGRDNNSNRIADLFDPATDAFDPAADPPASFNVHLAVAEAGGTVLLIGGAANTAGVVETVIRYDPATGPVAQVASLVTPRRNPVVIHMSDGRILIAGGSEPGNPLSMTARGEVIDPVAGSATLVGEMAIPRETFRAALLGDGRVVLAGGGLPFMGGVQGTEVYDAATQGFRPGPSPAGMAGVVEVIALPSGEVLLLGDSTWDVQVATDESAVYQAP